MIAFFIGLFIGTGFGLVVAAVMIAAKGAGE